MAGAADEGRTFGWFPLAPTPGATWPPVLPADDDRAPPVTVADRFTVKLMNDYGADWPLWTLSGPDGDATVEAAVDDELAARLRAWAKVFDQHFHYDHGWDDPHVAAAHRAEGEALRDALAAALPWPWRVVLDLWETHGT